MPGSAGQSPLVPLQEDYRRYYIDINCVLIVSFPKSPNVEYDNESLQCMLFST